MHFIKATKNLLIFCLIIFVSFSFAKTGFNDNFYDNSLVDTSSSLIQVQIDSNFVCLERQQNGINHSYLPHTSTVINIDSQIINGTEYTVDFPQEKGTIELWVKGDFKDSSFIGAIFDFHESSRNHIVLHSYGKYNMNSQLHFMDIEIPPYAYVYNFDFIPNVWNHFALTWDMANCTARIYLNGNIIKESSITNCDWRPNNQKVVLGKNFTGEIKSVRILSDVLDATEIQNDFSPFYESAGTLISKEIKPISLSAWTSINWTYNIVSGTSIKVYIEYKNDSTWTKIPDSILLGNSSGFDNSPVDISNISINNFPIVRLRADLATNDSTVTPKLLTWSLDWQSGLSHPRMYLTSAKQSFLQTKIDSNIEPYASYFSNIILKANSYVSQTPWARDDDRVIDAGQSREIGNRLDDIAMAWVFTRDSVYWKSLNEYVDSILLYPRWGINGDIGASHILFGMCLVYDWCYNDFSESKRNSIETKMTWHADTLFQILANNTWWHRSYLQNHNYVNVTSIMAAAVVLYDINPNSELWINEAYENFTNVLKVLSTDGASVEEVPYWGYGIEALLRYFALEESFLKEDRIINSEWFSKTWKYRLYSSLPNSPRVANFGDSPNYDWYGAGYINQRLASKFNNPMAQQFAFDIIKARQDNGYSSLVDYRNLVWYNDSISSVSYFSLPTYHYFEDLELYTSYSAWNDSNALYFTFEAGPPMGHSVYSKLDYDAGSAHQHPDKGHFLLYGYGEALIVDNGYSYLKRTASHNIVTFDSGQGQIGEGKTWFDANQYYPYTSPVSITHTDLQNDYEYLVADLSGIYQAELGLKKYERHFLWIKNHGFLLVVDDINLDSIHNIEWRLHMDTSSIISIMNNKLEMNTVNNNAGFLLENISESIIDTQYVLDYETSDTVVLETRIVVNTGNSKMFAMEKKASSAKFETVIRPFNDDIPSALNVTRNFDTLRIALDSLVIEFSADNHYVKVSKPASSLNDKNIDNNKFELHQNFPNPFNPITEIKYSIPNLGSIHHLNVKLSIYDSKGKLIKNLVDEKKNADFHSVIWNGFSNNGRKITSGIYFYHLTVKSKNGVEFKSVKKMILLK